MVILSPAMVVLIAQDLNFGTIHWKGSGDLAGALKTLEKAM